MTKTQSRYVVETEIRILERDPDSSSAELVFSVQQLTTGETTIETGDYHDRTSRMVNLTVEAMLRIRECSIALQTAHHLLESESGSGARILTREVPLPSA